MLQTINISLPRQLAVQVDDVIDVDGYVSRSEFFRTLIRMYFSVFKQGDFAVPFQKKPIKQVRKSLKTAGYNKQFVKSVTAGLKKSSMYK